jgi:LysW-gamma-L-lysine carboxypeptidase
MIGEPSGVNHVVIGYKGIFRFRLRTRAPAAHTSSPQAPAAELAVAAWTAISRWLDGLYPADAPLFDRALPTLAGFSADLEVATMDISCRVPIGFDAAVATERLREIAGAAGTVTIVESTAAVRSARRDVVARSLRAAMRDHGLAPAVKVKLGTSDMNLAVTRWGRPTAAYGPGDSHLCHGADEHIDLTEFRTSIDVLAGALVRLADAVRAGQ